MGKLKLDKKYNGYEIDIPEYENNTKLDDYIDELIKIKTTLESNGATDIYIHHTIEYGYYDERDFHIQLVYKQEESDAEYNIRMQAEAKSQEKKKKAAQVAKKAREANERKTYEKLKKKFEK